MTSTAGATLGPTATAVTYTNGGNISLVSSLLNTVVTAKTLQGLPTPAAATVVAADTILEGIGKLQSQINGIANGLQFQGTWNASMDTGGADVTPNGTPALTSGGGEASSGTTDATTTDELVDSTKDFTAAPNIVAVGDKVINQVDGQEALVNDIANAASGRLGLAADIMLDAEAYIIDKTPFITAGHYYVVDAVGATTARNATLNGIQDWQVGDWVIASVNNVWQKLNNSAVEGSGTENRLTKWAAAASTLVDSGIIDNGTTIKLENDTELGAASTDTINSVGVHQIDEQLNLKKGLGVWDASLATPAFDYGDTTNKVLTSGNGSANPPAWVNRSTWGYVDNVALTHYGDAFVVTVTDGGGPDVGLAIAAKTGASATDYINGIGNITAFPVLDNYVSWTADSDEGTDITVTSGFNLKFTGAVTAGGAGISTDSAISTDEMTIGLINSGTPSATTFYSGTGAWAVPAGTGVTSVTGTLPIVSSGGTTPAISINTMGAAAAATAGLKGAVPPSAAGDQLKFLRADATWVIPTNTEGVTAVTATVPLSSTGGDTPVISHNASGVATGTYDSVTVDVKGHVTAGSNTTKLTASCSKSLSLAASWTPMFALQSSLGMGKISEVWVNKVIATLAGGGALSAQVAQAGVSGTWNGSADSQTATNIVYNKIIDTANGELEVRFVSYNPLSNVAGYKCEARVLNTQGTVEITVTWNNVDTSTYPTTFTDLT
jgi:hypothetical protein